MQKAKAAQVMRGRSQGVRQDWKAVGGEARRMTESGALHGGCVDDTISGFLGKASMGFSGSYKPTLLSKGKEQAMSTEGWTEERSDAVMG